MQLVIDTEGCQNYATQIDQVIALYETVQDWSTSENDRCYRIAMQNNYASYNDPMYFEKQSKVAMAMNRQSQLLVLQPLIGTRCLARLKRHFLEVSKRIISIEDTISSRGEKLFNL